MGHMALAKGAVAQTIAHRPGLAGCCHRSAPHRIGRRSSLAPARHLAAFLTIHPGEALHPLIPAQGRAPAAGDVALDEFTGQLREKHRGHGGFAHAAPQAPFTGVRQKQPLLRPGHAHVAKAPLLLQRRRILQGAVAGEQALFQPHQKHHWKLQALAGVQGHQGDPILFRVLGIGIAGQGRRGQEILQRSLLVFLLVLQGRIHQLIEVAAAIFRLIGAIGDQLGHIAALLHHPLHQFRRRSLLAAALQVIDQLAELQQPLG